jgi:NitT/TauT family transport system substrate-binding protein
MVRLVLALLVALAASAAPAQATDKVRFLTSWFAEPEQGGFYEAKANGLYDKAGLDVTIRMGGPQLNTIQLLVAGEADFIIGYDFQTLTARSHGLPVVTVATSFQSDVAGILTHDDITSIEALKGKPIAIGAASRLTFWPWLRQKYGFTDDQIRPYAFSMQPFFADPALSQQGYITFEPFVAAQHGVKTKFFLLSDYGYAPYSTTIVTTDAYVKAHPDIVARFVKASLEGWRDYLRDPAPANKLIQADNPKMSDAELAFADDAMRKRGLVDGGDAATKGIGIMTEAHWQKTADFMIGADLLPANTDWHAAFTDRFVKDLAIH